MAKKNKKIEVTKSNEKVKNIESLPKPESKTTKPFVNEIEKKDFFENLGNKGIWAALAVLAFVTLVVFKDYIFFYKVFCFKDIACDTYNLTYPYLYSTAEYMAKHGIPKWTFSAGMGQNTFPFFLRDPFELILLYTGKNNIYYLLGFVEIAKVLLSGWLFFLYLKQLKLSDYTSIAGSLMFAFCSFMIEGGGWYAFSFEAFNFAVMMLAFEQLYMKGKWMLFPIAIFLMGMSQPVNVYVYGLFLALYTVLRLYQDESFNIKSLGILYLKMIGLGAIGLLLSGPFLLENVLQLIESPRGSGNTSLAYALSSAPMFKPVSRLEFGSGIMRLFSNDLMYSGDNYKGWQNILEAPMYYFGLPCLILMPQVFQFLNKTKKIVFAIFLGLWIFPIFFPYFRHAFWLFAGDYYRAYSFFVGFIFLIYGLWALDFVIKSKSVNLVMLIATVIGLFVLLNYPYFNDGDFVNPSLKIFIAVLILIYAVLVFLIGKQQSNINIKYMFFGLLVLEMCYLPGITVNERDALLTSELSEKTGYNDYTVDAMNFIHKTDKSFFRIDKSYFSGVSRFGTLNDGLVQDYFGTSSYNPFNQLYYVKFLQLVDLAHEGNELESRWTKGLISKPIIESENQVKYFLGKNVINPLWRVIGDSIGTFGDVRVYKNKIFLPLGYTYKTFIKESVYRQLPSLQKDFVSLYACVIGDKDLQNTFGLNEFQLKDTFASNVFNVSLLFAAVNQLKQDTMQIKQFDENHLSGTITVSDDKMMYLSIPYDAGWHLKVDGQPREKVILSAGMTGVLLKKGTHNIEMNYELRLFNKGLLMSIGGILIFLVLWFFTRKKKEALPELR